MAGSIIVTDMNFKKAIKLVSNVAQDEGYFVNRVEEDELEVGKNNVALAIFLGPLFMPYARFKIFFNPEGSNVEIEMQRNSPWWQGWYGPMRVKGMFKKLVNAIEDEIEDAGGRILSSEDFK